MRHPSLDTGDTDWSAIRLVIYSQDDSFRFLARSTFRKLEAADVLSTSVAVDIPTFLARQPQLVVVDLDGDGEAGLAVLATVRAPATSPCPQASVLVVVKGGDKACLSRALALGVEGILPKPVSGHELMMRVDATLRRPQRLPAGPVAAARPKIVLVPAPPAEPGSSGMVEGDAVKAEIARLTARLGVVVASPPPPPPPQRHGGGGGLVVGRSVPTAAKAAGGKLSAEDLAPAVPGKGGKLSADDLAPAAKPKGGKLSADDLAPAVPGKGGKHSADDLAPAVGGGRERLAQAAPPELRPPPPAAADEAGRKRAAKAKAEWQDSLQQAGHCERTGADVAALDVTAIVAAHLEWLHSQGGRGQRANFEGMDLAGGDLSRTVLAGAGFRRADLSDATLAEARLDGADFRFATLSAADCGGAVLAVAQLRHADLRLANLEGASLRGADLSGARLGGARLAGADFDGATLVETDLREADLSQVENLRQAQLDKAAADRTTRLPAGLRLRRPPEE